MFVDDCGIGAPSQDIINNFVKALRQKELDLAQEGSLNEIQTVCAPELGMLSRSQAAQCCGRAASCSRVCAKVPWKLNTTLSLTH